MGNQGTMAAAMPRGELIGLRCSAEEVERIDRLVAHLEAAHPGVKFTRQMAIKHALALVERQIAAPVPTPAPSRPRKKTSR